MIDPRVTVVIATYNRGRHIVPTVQSVLAQTMQRFELLVIGDGCTDDTEEHLQPLLSDKVRWINLQERWGAQSGPNTRGLQEARAPVVAFLGHDDIWSPRHLEDLIAIHDAGAADCVVSGLAQHNESDWRAATVTGLFDPDTAAAAVEKHFFPPTSTSLTRAIARKVGPWPRREDTPLAVDYCYQDRLVAAGARYRSTGRITAHKLAASSRYLSYLEPSSDEQAALLARVTALHAQGQDDDWQAELIAAAKADGVYMLDTSGRRTNLIADLPKRLDQVRGVARPTLLDLGEGIDVAQTSEPRGLDWATMRDVDNGMRRTGPNDRCRLLLPVTHDGPVQLDIEVLPQPGMSVEKLVLCLNGSMMPIECTKLAAADGAGFWPSHRLRGIGRLRPDRASILQFEQPSECMTTVQTGMRFGISVGTVSLRPSKETACPISMS